MDRARRHDILQVKEALNIQAEDNHFNRDVGIEVLACSFELALVAVSSYLVSI